MKPNDDFKSRFFDFLSFDIYVDYHSKNPPKHQPTVPAFIALPSLSFAPFCTSTCVQLLEMPSIVSAFVLGNVCIFYRIIYHKRF